MRGKLLVVCFLVSTLLVPWSAAWSEGTETDAASPLKIAVLPFWLPGIAQDYTHVVMDALYTSMEETEIFVPEYAYYQGDDRYAPKPLRDGRFNGKLWSRKGFFADYKPDSDLVFQVGKELGVDAVITYSVEITGSGNDRMTGFLFDVRNKRFYTHRKSDEIKHNYTGEVSEQTLESKLKEITEHLFFKF